MWLRYPQCISNRNIAFCAQWSKCMYSCQDKKKFVASWCWCGQVQLASNCCHVYLAECGDQTADVLRVLTHHMESLWTSNTPSTRLPPRQMHLNSHNIYISVTPECNCSVETSFYLRFDWDVDLLMGVTSPFVLLWMILVIIMDSRKRLNAMALCKRGSANNLFGPETN